MSFIRKNIKLLFGRAIIKANNNNNFIVSKELKYSQNSPFLYQYGRVDIIENYKEEVNTYTLNTKNELPLHKTSFLCNKHVENNIINYYIKTDSYVNYIYIKIFSKEFIFIRAM